MDVALALICVMETNPIRKQLYLSNKMDRFSYKGGCGECEHTHIEAFKRRAGLDYRQTVPVNTYSKTNTYGDVYPLFN